MRTLRLALLASLVAGPAAAQFPFPTCSSISVVQLSDYFCHTGGLYFYFPPQPGWTSYLPFQFTTGTGSVLSAPTSYELVWTKVYNTVTLTYRPVGAQALSVTATAGSSVNNQAQYHVGFSYHVGTGPGIGNWRLSSLRGHWGVGTTTFGSGAGFSSGSTVFGLQVHEPWFASMVANGIGGNFYSRVQGSNFHFDQTFPDSLSVHPRPEGQYFAINASLSVRATTNEVVSGFATTSVDAEFATSFTSTPEPSTWAMMLTGLAGIGVVAWRRRRA